MGKSAILIIVVVLRVMKVHIKHHGTGIDGNVSLEQENSFAFFDMEPNEGLHFRPLREIPVRIFFFMKSANKVPLTITASLRYSG